MKKIVVVNPKKAQKRFGQSAESCYLCARFDADGAQSSGTTMVVRLPVKPVKYIIIKHVRNRRD